jgi:hypothetical protein
MPSFKQKYGTDAPATGTPTLIPRERNHIRSKLGIANDPKKRLFIETEERMQAFVAEQVDEARALYKALDKLGDSTTRIQGGNRGLYVSEADDRGVLRRELMNLILPTEEQVLSEAVATVTEDELDGDTLTAVPVRYSNRDKRTDEYGC